MLHCRIPSFCRNIGGVHSSFTCRAEDSIAFPAPYVQTVMKRSGSLRGPGLWPVWVSVSDWWAFLCLPLPLAPPPRYPLLSPPLGDEQAHYYGILTKGGHYLLTVHFDLWQRTLLLPFPSFWLCNAAIGGPLPVFSVRPPPATPDTLGSSPRTCHSHIHRILACRRTKSISIFILPRCSCQHIWSLSASAFRKMRSMNTTTVNTVFYCLIETGLFIAVRSVSYVYFILIY